MRVKTIAEKQQEYANAYKRKFESLRREDPQKAKVEATKELIKMGILDKNGNTKAHIVSWE